MSKFDFEIGDIIFLVEKEGRKPRLFLYRKNNRIHINESAYGVLKPESLAFIYDKVFAVQTDLFCGTKDEIKVKFFQVVDILGILFGFKFKKTKHHVWAGVFDACEVTENKMNYFEFKEEK